MGRRGAVPSDYLSGLVAAHEQVAHAMERIVLPPAVVRSFRLNARSHQVDHAVHTTW